MNAVENAVDSSWAQPGVPAHVTSFAAAPIRVRVERVSEHFVTLDNGWKFPRESMELRASSEGSAYRDVHLVPVPDYAAAAAASFASVQAALNALSEEALGYAALVDDPQDVAFERNMLDLREDLMAKVDAANAAWHAALDARRSGQREADARL